MSPQLNTIYADMRTARDWEWTQLRRLMEAYGAPRSTVFASDIQLQRKRYEAAAAACDALGNYRDLVNGEG
jgi:hypothetical protein